MSMFLVAVWWKRRDGGIFTSCVSWHFRHS